MKAFATIPLMELCKYLKEFVSSFASEFVIVYLGIGPHPELPKGCINPVRASVLEILKWSLGPLYYNGNISELTCIGDLRGKVVLITDPEKIWSSLSLSRSASPFKIGQNLTKISQKHNIRPPFLTRRNAVISSPPTVSAPPGFIPTLYQSHILTTCID